MSWPEQVYKVYLLFSAFPIVSLHVFGYILPTLTSSRSSPSHISLVGGLFHLQIIIMICSVKQSHSDLNDWAMFLIQLQTGMKLLHKDRKPHAPMKVLHKASLKCFLVNRKQWCSSDLLQGQTPLVLPKGSAFSSRLVCLYQSPFKHFRANSLVAKPPLYTHTPAACKTQTQSLMSFLTGRSPVQSHCVLEGLTTPENFVREQRLKR